MKIIDTVPMHSSLNWRGRSDRTGVYTVGSAEGKRGGRSVIGVLTDGFSFSFVITIIISFIFIIITCTRWRRSCVHFASAFYFCFIIQNKNDY